MPETMYSVTGSKPSPPRLPPLVTRATTPVRVFHLYNRGSIGPPVLRAESLPPGSEPGVGTPSTTLP
eukprot:scaffold4081_cov268-Pinguiococcus_pyrenoidosus.AAC.12